MPKPKAYTGIYASPTGSATAAGTIDDPLDIDTAIGASSPVQPGETLWLRGGTYSSAMAGGVYGTAGVEGKGVYRFRIAGTSSAQLTVRSFPGEWAVLNAGLELNGNDGVSYLTIRNLEIKSTPTTRQFASDAEDTGLPPVWCANSALGMKLINCYLHDIQQLFWFEVGASEIHGNLIAFTGYYDVEEARHRGYNIYTHNEGGGNVQITKNAFVAPFNGRAAGLWSAGTADILDYDVNDNVALFAGFGAGNGSGADNENNNFLRNYFHHRQSGANDDNPLEIQNADNQQDGAGITVSANYMDSNVGFAYFRTRQADIQINTFVIMDGLGQAIMCYYHAPTAAVISVTIDNNSYIYTGPRFGDSFWNNEVSDFISFAEWKTATGWDANTTYSEVTPTANVVKVIGNDYENRGYIWIANYSGGSTVTVDLTDIGLTDGAVCRYRNCLNWDEIVGFTYDADNPNLVISMAAADWSMRTPTAYDSPTAWFSEPYPNYAMFLVEELPADPELGIFPPEDGVLPDEIVRTGNLPPVGVRTGTLPPIPE